MDELFLVDESFNAIKMNPNTYWIYLFTCGGLDEAKPYSEVEGKYFVFNAKHAQGGFVTQEEMDATKQPLEIRIPIPYFVSIYTNLPFQVEVE